MANNTETKNPAPSETTTDKLSEGGEKTAASKSMQEEYEPSHDPGFKGLNNKQAAIKRAFASQPRVPILIPLEKNENQSSTMYFGINGYGFYVQKGILVEVPRQIAEMYYESVQVSTNVLRYNDRNLENHAKGANAKAFFGAS